VLPGQTLKISLQLKAPLIPGTYRTDWVLSNETRSNFKDPVYLRIIVAKLTTSTAVPPTPSPTP